jgi:hypothetical protein
VLIPVLVLSAELNFICATAALYALLSAILFHLFTRPAAEQFTVQSVLSVTHKTTAPHTTGISRGKDVAAEIEQASVTEREVDDSATAARINKIMGCYRTTVCEDLTTHHLLLEVDSQQRAVAPNLLLERYENVLARWPLIAWAYAPALGASLVGFGIAIWRRPYVVSHLPLDRNATLLSALFTWGMGVWRSLSLFAISNLTQQGNSDVGPPIDELVIFIAQCLFAFYRNGAVCSNGMATMA